MKKGPYVWLALAGLFASHVVVAQEAPDFVQFFVNSASLNPSYVAIDGQPSAHFGFRRQWAGVAGGPIQGQLSIQAPLPKKVMFGFTAFNNTRGMLSTSAVLFTGGYQVSLAEDQALRFGLSLGGAMTMVDVDGVTNPSDPQLANLTNSAYLQGNAGISYHRKTLHVGIALPQIIQPYYTVDQGAKIEPFGTVIIHASNRFYYARNKNVFEPYVVYRLNTTTPSQFEVAAVMHLQSKVWFGASYRQALGASVLGGIKLNKAMVLGYSFTGAVAKESQMPRPSHEAHLSLLFGKRDKNLTGVYSFVNIDKEKKKKSAAQLAAERAALAKKYEKQNVHNEPHKPAEKPVEKPVEKPAEVKPPDVVVSQPKADSVPAVVAKPVVERHEFVKAGANKNELKAGNYVIVGAFRSEANAKRFSLDLHQMDIEEASYGFITVRGLWYVYLAVADDLATTKADREKYRHEHMFKDAWILTVQ